MIISKFEINNFRIINGLSIEPSPSFNIIYGKNGSGKTALLEAIGYLSTAQSFRSSTHSQIIQFEKPNLLLRSDFIGPNESTHYLGMRRSRNGLLEAKYDGGIVKSISTITKVFPIKLIHPELHTLISGGPSLRRKYLDWGLFYLDESYQALWKNYSFALKQRNSLLKFSYTTKEFNVWTEQLSIYGEQLFTQRTLYFEKLLPFIVHWLDYFSLSLDLSFVLNPGWNTNQPLYEALISNTEKCKKFKTTTIGPHRADLLIKLSDIIAKNIISRGQQKLIVFSLIFAQISLLKDLTNKTTVLLLDDPNSELDKEHLNLLLSAVQNLRLQSFLSTTDPSICNHLHDKNLFNLKNGNLKQSFT